MYDEGTSKRGLVRPGGQCLLRSAAAVPCTHTLIALQQCPMAQVHDRNSGRDPFPVFLTRGPLPKGELPAHGATITPKLRKEQAYGPADFRIGTYIEVRTCSSSCAKVTSGTCLQLSLSQRLQALGLEAACIAACRGTHRCHALHRRSAD